MPRCQALRIWASLRDRVLALRVGKNEYLGHASSIEPVIEPEPAAP